MAQSLLLCLNSCINSLDRHQCSKTRDFYSEEHEVTVTVPWCSDVEINDSSYSVDAINFWRGFETERSMSLILHDISSFVKFKPSRGNIDSVLEVERRRAILDNKTIEFVSAQILKTEQANTLLLTMISPTGYYNDMCIIQFPQENIEVRMNYSEISSQDALNGTYQSTFHPDNFSRLKIRRHPKE